MPDLVPVRVRDCACPDTPHDEGDIVYLRPKVSLELGIRAQQAVHDAQGSAGEVTRAWLTLFVRYGAVDANFLDPFDVEAILDDFEIASPVAEAANDLYADTILRPLGLSPSKPSRGGPTTGSTSRTKVSRRASPG